MNLKQGAFVLTVAVVAAVVVVYVVSRQPSPEPPVEKTQVAETGEETVSLVYLYFGNPDSEYLSAETRSISHPGGPSALGRGIVEALIAGPATERVRTIPEKTVLNAFYLAEDATAYVDLSKTVVDAHPGGALSELMTVFSIVNSLVLNIPEVQQVKILIAGTDASTLGGHIDLRHPLAANMLIVR
jgi:hypothetical protein